MAQVYIVQHVHTTGDGSEDVKFIGVYSTLENAEATIARLTQLPGFAEEPEGFHIDQYQLDQDQWVEGYSTLAEV
jgi:homoserine kinase type II